MSRFSYIGTLLLGALLTGPLAAQISVTIQRTPIHRANTQPAQVQHVLVRGNGDAMEVEIQTSGAPVSPNTQAITGPDRIIVDFPGMLPSSELRALKVNRGALKGIRSGLFFSNPPITRIVLDLTEPQSYQISTIPNAIVVKLSGDPAASNQIGNMAPGAAAALRDASLPASPNPTSAHLVTSTVSATPLPAAGITNGNLSHANLQHSLSAADIAPQPPAKPAVNVTYQSGMLRIHAEKATLAQVLFEVHLRTQAEIAIPAGAEQEEVIADLGPAPARDVLASLLNGSAYNFIFVGDELALERVILTRRDPSNF